MARPLRVEVDGAIYHVTSRATPEKTSSMTMAIAKPSWRAETLLTKSKRDGLIVRAVHRYGYSQREVAAFLDLHYATVNRLANSPDTRSKT